jgi:hypothetical protein
MKIVSYLQTIPIRIGVESTWTRLLISQISRSGEQIRVSLRCDGVERGPQLRGKLVRLDSRHQTSGETGLRRARSAGAQNSPGPS